VNNNKNKIIFQFTWHSTGHLGACWDPNYRENRWRGSDSFWLSNSLCPLDSKINYVVWGKSALVVAGWRLHFLYYHKWRE